MADFHQPAIDLLSFINQNLKELKLAEDEYVDLSHKRIYDADLKNSLLEAIDELTNNKDDSLGAVDVWNILMERGVVGPHAQKRVRFLSFSLTSMDDTTFTEVTNLLLDRNKGINFVEKNGILDLSFNAISPSSIPQIIRWIDEKQIRFINLCGNPECSMRHVGDLCKSMKVVNNLSLEKINLLMAHIIFVPKYYIYHASTQVKIYRQLHDLGYLPDSWVEDQREYYRSLSNEIFPEDVLECDPDKDFSFIEEDIGGPV